MKPFATTIRAAPSSVAVTLVYVNTSEEQFQASNAVDGQTRYPDQLATFPDPDALTVALPLGQRLAISTELPETVVTS